MKATNRTWGACESASERRFTASRPAHTDHQAAIHSDRMEWPTRYAPGCRGPLPRLHTLAAGLTLVAAGLVLMAQAASVSAASGPPDSPPGRSTQSAPSASVAKPDTLAGILGTLVPLLACDPVPEGATLAHSECITAYSGPEVCIVCHEAQAREAHGSVHYQQGGAFPDTINIPTDFYAAGERPAHPEGELVATGLNTYCGTHLGSPRFTCAGCHVGNGRFPKSVDDFKQLAAADQLAELANIDCLMCHQELYKRFPDWTDAGYGFSTLELLNLREEDGQLIASPGDVVLREGYAGIPNVDLVTLDFEFLPAGIDTLPEEVPIAPMTITTLRAAQTVHATTRRACLNCHAGAAGSDGAKRGDLSRELVSGASATLDFHMSPDGADRTCSHCHNVGGHRLQGRGLDLRPSDVPERFTCESCHGDRPHKDYSPADGSRRDTHAVKVACQTCHIPRYGKAAVGTEVARDWQEPHPSAAACAGRGGWLPREDKAHDLVPSYAWFDGRSEVYYIGASLRELPTIPLPQEIAAAFVGDFRTGQKAYVMAAPAVIVGEDGRLNQHRGTLSPDAKIYPMKEHWGKLATDGEILIGHSTFEFFRTGSFCRAVAVGLGTDPDSACPQGVPGTELPVGIDVVAVHTFQTINHGVEPKGRALACGACHSSEVGGPPRLNLRKDLGYGLRQGKSLVAGARQQGPLSGNRDRICGQCHENAVDQLDFPAVHRVHVAGQQHDCALCHEFSRPGRGLRLAVGNPSVPL